jgi:asparagine synthase (glutamine-hydrolysing)
MCGLLTVIQKQHRELDISSCRRALSYLSWRGPDLNVSSVWKGFLFTGHNVLSLTGSPLNRINEYSRSKNGRYKIAFNGEIYNFRELAKKWLKNHITLDNKTTDTEILVNLYEVLSPEKIPQLLNGMYAYTLLDEFTGQLFVVRDSQGEKTLYIYEDDELIIIASELTAVKSIVGRIPLDEQALRDYFCTRHFMHFSRTSFLKTRQILPGYTECFNTHKGKWNVVASHSISDWINPDQFENNSSRTLDDLADELDALLIHVTRKMLPNCNFAAVASGGVDSSLLSYYLNKYGEPKIFIAVNNIGKDLISSDLSGFETVLSKKIEVVQVDKRDYAGEIPRCQQKSVSPLCSHSFVTQAIQSNFVRSAGCPIIFGGEGGDELFGGYNTYLDPINLTDQYSPSQYMSYTNPELEFIRNDPTMIRNELATSWRSSLEAYSFIDNKEEQFIHAMMYADSAFQLPSVALRGSDIMSMMWSVEARSIFLSKDIITFALNLPLAAKVNKDNIEPNLRTKVLLKKLFLRHYPKELLFKKQGFTGFPNESAEYLGNKQDYMVFEKLGIKQTKLSYSREIEWKIINLEYFLRQECL